MLIICFCYCSLSIFFESIKLIAVKYLCTLYMFCTTGGSGCGDSVTLKTGLRSDTDILVQYNFIIISIYQTYTKSHLIIIYLLCHYIISSILFIYIILYLSHIYIFCVVNYHLKFISCIL